MHLSDVFVLFVLCSFYTQNMCLRHQGYVIVCLIPLGVIVETNDDFLYEMYSICFFRYSIKEI